LNPARVGEVNAADFQNEKKSQATAQNRLAHLTKGTPMAWGSGENASKLLSGFFGIKLQCK
jgi:hypothetical protein